MRVKRVSVALALVLVLCLGACGKNESTVENTVEPETTIEEKESVTIETEAEPEVETEEQEPKEEIPVIYEENELINLYLNRYNEVNTEAPIESGDFEVYHHHGSDHKDQILIVEEGFNSIVITSQLGKLKIDIEGSNVEDAYKAAFLRYARGYNTELSVKVLEDYWEQSMSSLNTYTQFEDFEVYIRSYNDSIELLEISGEVE